MDYLPLYIIGGIVILSVVSWLWEKYGNARRDRCQKKLDQVARDTLVGFDFDREKDEIQSIISQHVPKSFRCPKCNAVITVGDGIYGKFLGCSCYPECDFFELAANQKTKPIRAQDVYKIYKLSKCPKCGGILLLRDGMHGKFLGCSNYPKCKYTRSI
jgi:ssDNA-binding Zn-finger/Zn-ribbon topoisomerase 1